MKNLFKSFYKKASIMGIAIMLVAVSTTTNGAIENKSSRFSAIISEMGAKNKSGQSNNTLRDAVENQIAAADALDLANASQSQIGANSATVCDSGLRKCMQEKCGSDFSKCATDGEQTWNGKMDACRKKTKCSAHEYTELAAQIKKDRDTNVKTASYEAIIKCGNDYNKCIFTNCGSTLENCLSKADGDKVISKCESIARECKTRDSGLASRVMSVFGGKRKIATNTARRDEERLSELRDLMRAQCNRLGAMFDDRTLDCVYTVNFFAGDDASTPTASKKLYAGDMFQCTPNWFGIDVTTFKENAYRLTRSQTSASSAALGAGVGTAAGMISSGAINRAIDRTKAEKAVKEAEKDKDNAEKKSRKKDDKKDDSPKPANTNDDSKNTSNNNKLNANTKVTEPSKTTGGISNNATNGIGSDSAQKTKDLSNSNVTGNIDIFGPGNAKLNRNNFNLNIGSSNSSNQ